MGLMNFIGESLVKDAKTYVALGTAKKVLEEINKRIPDTGEMTEEEKARAEERAAKWDARIEKMKTAAVNAVQRVQDSIEKMEAERQAAFESEVSRLRDSYPIEWHLQYPESGWLNKAKLIDSAGKIQYTIKTSSFLGKRKIVLFDYNRNQEMTIEENRAAFGPLAGERPTYFIISEGEVQKATTRRETVKFHNVFYLNEYKWHTGGKSSAGQILNQNDEVIAEWLNDRGDDSRVMMFFRYPETVMLSIALAFVKMKESSHSFSSEYSNYYSRMIERHAGGGDI